MPSKHLSQKLTVVKCPSSCFSHQNIPPDLYPLFIRCISILLFVDISITFLSQLIELTNQNRRWFSVWADESPYSPNYVGSNPMIPASFRGLQFAMGLFIVFFIYDILFFTMMALCQIWIVIPGYKMGLFTDFMDGMISTLSISLPIFPAIPVFSLSGLKSLQWYRSPIYDAPNLKMVMSSSRCSKWPEDPISSSLMLNPPLNFQPEQSNPHWLNPMKCQ